MFICFVALTTDDRAANLPLSLLDLSQSYTLYYTSSSTTALSSQGISPSPFRFLFFFFHLRLFHLSCSLSLFYIVRVFWQCAHPHHPLITPLLFSLLSPISAPNIFSLSDFIPPFCLSLSLSTSSPSLLRPRFLGWPVFSSTRIPSSSTRHSTTHSLFVSASCLISRIPLSLPLQTELLSLLRSFLHGRCEPTDGTHRRPF